MAPTCHLHRPAWGQTGQTVTHRIAIDNAEDCDHLAGVAYCEEGAVMGVRHIRHGALGLQELVLGLQCGAQDGVQADIPILQGTDKRQ